MKTLWQQQGKDFGADWFFNFTAAEDRQYDIPLIPYDIISNLAQAQVLLDSGLITIDDFTILSKALRELFNDYQQGSFTLTDMDEDVHSATERALTERTGDVGKKIHAGRSRNDLVLSDIRLFVKVELRSVVKEWLEIAAVLQDKSEQQKGIYFPGYTHTQSAMPNSADAWFTGYLEILTTGIDSLRHAYTHNDKSPLGSAAGFGVPYLDLNREKYAELLGFRAIQYAVTSVQLSRGLFEMKIIEALSETAQVFNRLASDVVCYAGSDKKFVDLSNDQVSGSSVMPQKRNPDAWELIRGESHRFASYLQELQLLNQNMISGYHRDLQIIKKIIMDSLAQIHKINEALKHAISGISFNSNNCRKALTRDLFATHIANKYTMEGLPFREAYRKAGTAYSQTDIPSQDELQSSYKQTGAPGQCDAHFFDALLDSYYHWLELEDKKWSSITDTLLRNL